MHDFFQITKLLKACLWSSFGQLLPTRRIGVFPHGMLGANDGLTDPSR